MNPKLIISKIIERVDNAETAQQLYPSVVATDDAALFSAANETFGSWDGALAEALVFLRRFYETIEERDREDGAESEEPDIDRPERRVGPSATVFAYIIGQSGYPFTLGLDDVVPSPTPALSTWSDAPAREHLPARVSLGDDDTSIVVVTTRGQCVAIDNRLIAEYRRETVIRPLTRFGGIDDDEVAVTVIPRRALRGQGRLYTVSVLGQFKASTLKDYAKLSSDASVGVLLKDDDALLTAFVGDDDAKICVASSHGKALVFEAGEVRSQGRKATGVRAISLESDARVVGAFHVSDDGYMILATDHGLFKRMRMKDFRPQGRAGGGLQTCRLNAGDQVACVTQAQADGDVIVVTNIGRVARFPAYDVPFFNRAAKGAPLLELDEGETIAHMIGVVAGAFPETA